MGRKNKRRRRNFTVNEAVRGMKKMVSDCEFKISYNRAREAKIMAKLYGQRHYSCPHCQMYHLSSS